MIKKGKSIATVVKTGLFTRMFILQNLFCIHRRKSYMTIEVMMTNHSLAIHCSSLEKRKNLHRTLQKFILLYVQHYALQQSDFCPHLKWTNYDAQLTDRFLLKYGLLYKARARAMQKLIQSKRISNPNSCQNDTVHYVAHR